MAQNTTRPTVAAINNLPDVTKRELVCLNQFAISDQHRPCTPHQPGVVALDERS